MTSISILMTCYNRVETTLKCLSRLSELKVPSNFVLDTYLVDDNSPDQTGTIVKQNYRDVNVINGNGNLFWCRGMCLAWKTALKKKNYDYFLWLNDDTFLYKYSLTELMNISKKQNNNIIVSGSVQSKNNGVYTYGGLDAHGNKVLPNSSFNEIKYMNGNVVLVPKKIVQNIGIMDTVFTHHLGDYDYGLRAIKHGYKINTTTRYVGTCEKEKNSKIRSREMGVNLLKRFQSLYSPLGSNPLMNYKYYKRHYSLFYATKVIIYTHYINVLSDNKYLKKYGEKI
jgi:GT2 family glycosyltransferase